MINISLNNFKLRQPRLVPCFVLLHFANHSLRNTSVTAGVINKEGPPYDMNVSNLYTSFLCVALGDGQQICVVYLHFLERKVLDE